MFVYESRASLVLLQKKSKNILIPNSEDFHLKTF